MAGAFQCGAFQQSAFQMVCGSDNDALDTHDGFDTDSYRLAKEAQQRHDKEFSEARKRLREVLRAAWDGPGKVAEEVREIASPYVDILESGALRIDYAALESRRSEVMAELLAFQDRLGEEFQALMRESDEDDSIALLMNQ